MSARRFVLPVAIVAALAISAAVPPAFAAVIGGQFRFWSFADGNDLRDPIVYASAGPAHVQLEYWSPLRGEGQFRPEAGFFVRDSRRSTYSATWRHERNQERLWLGTEQVLARGFTARATVGPILPHDGGEGSVVYDAGSDWYWGDYSFAGVTVVHDPREGGLWSVPLRARFANERNDWLQVTVAPASRRTFGWALDARRGIVRAGVERNSRFDFTTRDNVIFTVGFEATLPRP